ncbi:MAG: DNA internalization-related competence protein ComEC/Rec2 [Gammaproteobacteria bacterium]|nr:DNA internalization-related competence protein ComEC/Rec2 [Gammaproteobacteria bacterium]
MIIEDCSRPFVQALAFLLGVLACQMFQELPDKRWALLIGVLAAVIYWVPRLRIPAVFALGLLWAIFRADLILSRELPAMLEGKDAVAEGYVSGLPKVFAHGVQFDFKVSYLHGLGRTWPSPGRIRLSWYRQPSSPIDFANRVRPGQKWHLTVRLKRPHGMANPGGFDYEAWLLRQRLRAKGYIRDKGEHHLLPEPVSFSIDTVRYRLAETIQDAIGSDPASAMVLALALGIRQDISDEEWETLRNTGTNHLIAISGLHIGFISTLVFLLSRWLWRRIGIIKGQTLMGLPAPRPAVLFGLLAAVVYAGLAGFSIPTQRALIMVAAAMSRIAFVSRTAVSNSVALALMLMLIWDPLTVMAPGFWLSFAAVGAILYGLSGQIKPRWAWLQVHRLVFIGLIPLLLYWFGQIPLLSIPANLLAVPWVALFIVPLTLTGSLLISIWPSAGGFCLQVSAQHLDWLKMFLEFLANWEWAVWQPVFPPLWAALAAGAGVLILLLPKGFPARRLGFIWLLPAFFSSMPQPREGELWFTLLDVGQGLAAVLRTREHVLIYDTGPKFSTGFNTGKAVAVPFLRFKGVKRIDTLLISHGDNDHIGGASSVLAEFPGTRILTSVPQKFPRVAAIKCLSGHQWEWDGVRFEILHPPANKHAFRRSNNRSCVLKASTAGASVLLPGDIEKKVEFRLVQKYQSRLQADILVAPHHGSRTSSRPGFIEAVNPAYVLFPVGYQNRFRFPKADVVERYRERDIRVLNTAQHGAIAFVLSPDGISTPKITRREIHRYWHD